MMSSRLWRFISPLIVLGLAYGLRLYRLDFQSIWWDEGHSIFVATQPIPQIPTLPAMDVHPPAYFALLHLWMALAGSSEFALRYLSVIFSSLTVALLWRFAHTLTSAPPLPRSPAPLPPCSLAPFLAALFAALSPLFVAYAQEVRSYAMITFSALGSTFALWQIIAPSLRHQTAENRPGFDSPLPYKWLLLYIFFSAACLYTHYFSIFLLLFHNLVWLGWVIYGFLTTRKFSGATRALPKQQLLIWFGSQLATLLLFLPQLRLALGQVTTYTNPNLIPPAWPHFISQTWQAYTVGLTIDPALAQWGMWGIMSVLVISHLLLVICHLSFVTRHSSPMTNSQFPITDDRSPITDYRLPITYYSLLFLLAWLILPLAAYFLVLQRQPSFEPRYAMLVTPALFLLLAISVSEVGSQGSGVRGRGSGVRGRGSGVRSQESKVTHHASRITFYASLTLLIAIFAIGLHSYYTNETYFKDDSAGVAAWLAQETGPHDIVYVDVPHPFHYYSDDISAPTRYLFVDIHTAAQTLNREAADKERLFWVTWRGSDTDPRGVIPFLVEKVGRPLGQRDFKGYRVQWYHLPTSETTFSLPQELTPLQATFGEVLRLDGVAHARTTPAGSPAWAILHFTLLGPTDIDYRVSVRLRDEAGNIIQNDRDLLNDRHFRTSAWPLDDPALNQAINVYTLHQAPPGEYQLEVIVYNAEPPYPSEGVNGVASSDGVSAILGRVSVIP